MAKLIPLTKGKSAIVDDEDYEILSQWSWCFNNGYAKRGFHRSGKTVSVRMHRQIMNTPDGWETDHINRNKLDNRRCNLRICNRTVNLFNRDKQSNNTTGFKGVSFNKFHKKFCAQIRFNGRNRNLGYFHSPNDAHSAYQEAHQKIVSTLCP